MGHLERQRPILRKIEIQARLGFRPGAAAGRKKGYRDRTG